MFKSRGVYWMQSTYIYAARLWCRCALNTALNTLWEGGGSEVERPPLDLSFRVLSPTSREPCSRQVTTEVRLPADLGLRACETLSSDDWGLLLPLTNRPFNSQASWCMNFGSPDITTALHCSLLPRGCGILSPRPFDLWLFQNSACLISKWHPITVLQDMSEKMDLISTADSSHRWNHSLSKCPAENAVLCWVGRTANHFIRASWPNLMRLLCWVSSTPSPFPPGSPNIKYRGRGTQQKWKCGP